MKVILSILPSKYMNFCLSPFSMLWKMAKKWWKISKKLIFLLFIYFFHTKQILIFLNVKSHRKKFWLSKIAFFWKFKILIFSKKIQNSLRHQNFRVYRLQRHAEAPETIQYPWYKYLKHSSRSYLSNARQIILVRHVEMNRRKFL